MISERNAKRYCSEDITLIENYHQAIADKERMWEIHHRRECDDEGRTLFTGKQLIEMNLYYHRPASELIFVTHDMHRQKHSEMLKQQWKNRCSKGGKIGGKIVGGNKNASIAAKLANSIPVLQFTKDGIFVKEWPSAKEACRQLNIGPPNLCHCLKGRYKSAGGYIWKYKKA